MKLPLTKFAKYAWGVLVYNVFVILFGAYVRASGSGAGCGAHWPLCNGVVVPRPERIQTVIEFTHRVTSGLTLPLIALLLFWAWRNYAKGNPIRISSLFAVLFIITEALIGAWLVLFHLVEQNDSMIRAVSVMAHLVNTFLLLASLTVTAWWATDGTPKRLKTQGIAGPLLFVGAFAILLLGASGAVTALGDTLFPSSSLAAGVREDFSPTAHYLIRMRIYHPGIAISVGIYLLLVTLWVRRNMLEPRMEAITTGLFGIYGLQVVLGITNVALLAPIWMQIIHLLVSNLVWITYILMTVIVLSSAIPVRAADSPPSLGDHKIHDRVNQPEKVG